MVDRADRAPIVLGAADGLVIVLGLVAGMVVARQAAGAVWHAALSAGLAELVGMTAALWLSDARVGFRRALSCGVASAGGAILPAVPYLAAGGWPATAAALALVAAAGGLVAWLRPERGAGAVAQTYGCLIAAAALCAAVGVI